jgi:F0F1-type ATP synthase membrane subunit b/b'
MEKQAQELLEDADQHLAAAQREAGKLVAAAERRAEEARALLERHRQEAEMVRTRTETEAAELVGTASEKANIMIEAASQRLDEAARLQAAAEQDALVFKEWLRKQTTCIDEMMRANRDMKMLVDRLHGDDTPASSSTK